jgi:hypothetical protein
MDRRFGNVLFTGLAAVERVGKTIQMVVKDGTGMLEFALSA